VILLKRMTQRHVAVDFVGITSTLFGAGHIPSINKITDNRLGGAFRNANELGNVSSAEIRIAGETNQDMAVIGEKSPLRLI
jgi:hypothetical protein